MKKENNTIFNERIKYRAQLINNMATSFFTIGFLSPLVGAVMYYKKPEYLMAMTKSDILVTIILLLTSLFSAIMLHMFGINLLKKLKG